MLHIIGFLSFSSRYTTLLTSTCFPVSGDAWERCLLQRRKILMLRRIFYRTRPSLLIREAKSVLTKLLLLQGHTLPSIICLLRLDQYKRLECVSVLVEHFPYCVLKISSLALQMVTLFNFLHLYKPSSTFELVFNKCILIST